MIRRLIVAVAVVAGLLLPGPLGSDGVGAKDNVNLLGVVVGDDDAGKHDRRRSPEPPWACIANHPLNVGVCLYDPLPGLGF
jgi:hypothetical protein